MNPAFIVAKNTFKEMIRDRVLYFIVFFAVLFMMFCVALGQLSYKEIFRLSVSLGLGGIHICFCGLTIFLGCSVFYRELERKTIYTLLVRPISRAEYLIGKYLGLIAVLFVMLLGFILCFTLTELTLGTPILWTSYYSFVGFFFEACILLAITFLFSSFAKPFVAISGSLSLFLVGHWIANMNSIAQLEVTPEGFRTASKIISKILPDLEMLNWRDYAIAQTHVPPKELGMGIVLAIAWSFVIFCLSLIIFRKKDFE